MMGLYQIRDWNRPACTCEACERVWEAPYAARAELYHWQRASHTTDYGSALIFMFPASEEKSHEVAAAW